MKILGLYGPSPLGAGPRLGAAGLVRGGWRRIDAADEVRAFLAVLNPLIAPGVRLNHVVDARGWDEALDGVYSPELARLEQLVLDAGRHRCRLDERIEALVEHPARRRRTLDATGLVITGVRTEDVARTVRAHGGRVVEVLERGARAGSGPLPAELVDDVVTGSADMFQLGRRLVRIAYQDAPTGISNLP